MLFRSEGEDNKMPYSKKRYGSKTKYKKYKSCIRKVKKKGKKVNPYAVCRKSLYKKRKRR